MSCFENADRTICIDHHISNNSFADVNYVEPQSSSACEVLYTTFDEDKVDKNVAECIYTGIIHDTGVFKYSCTSRRTMDIAGKMMEMGIDYSDIIDNSFYKKSYIQNQILGRALLESVLFYDGRYIIHQGFRKLVSMMLRRHRWAYASLLWEKDLPNPLWARRVSMTA